MRHAVYLLILAACFVGTLPLELWLGARVYRQWPRLLFVLACIVVLFGGWDILAIRAHHWYYDGAYLVGVTLPGHLPLEELLFFVVIPTCAILTLEAVRARRPEWLE
ncbi:MAG: lycopene cyclase domain-containing protein [Jatrophihabitans sp.]|uniref:lycopene cyclase domain-containing protein n=1 Tax=Jatrophihabitans sp. TaxID=1932789 RepID=UPI003F8046FD